MRCSFPVLYWLVLQWQYTNGDGNKEPCSVSIKNKLHHYWRRTGKDSNGICHNTAAAVYIVCLKRCSAHSQLLWQNLYLYKWQPVHITFLCQLCVFPAHISLGFSVDLVSWWLPVTDANRQHYHNVFPPLSLDKRGSYRNYTDSILDAGYWPFVRFWLLFIDF